VTEEAAAVTIFYTKFSLFYEKIEKDQIVEENHAAVALKIV
jgi:hypothetical protein